MEPVDLDLPTLTPLVGNAVVRMLLTRVARDGHTGLRPSHGYLIQRLVEDEPTISGLAASLGITQQGASKQVRELEELGYVERRQLPADGRVRGVRLTDRGREVLEAGRRARAELEAELVAQVGKKDTETARRVLAALLEIIGLGDDVRRRSVPIPGD